MDPNANLAEIRSITAQRTEDEEWLQGDQTDRLCELIESLDEWLSKGGSLPKAWKRY